MRDLSYRNLPQIAAAHNGTTPAPPTGFRGVAYSTTLGTLVVWTGSSWRRVPRGYDIPSGGTAGQVLTKSGAGDTEFGWAAPPGGGGGGGATVDGMLGIQTNNDVLTSNGQSSIQTSFPGGETVFLASRSFSGRTKLALYDQNFAETLTAQPHQGDFDVSYWQPAGNGTTVTQVGFAPSTVGTATAANVAVTNLHQAHKRLEYAVTTASATAVAGIRGAQNFMMGAGGRTYGGFYAKFRFGPSRGAASNSTRRWFVGFAGTGAAPTDVNPSGWNANLVGVGCDQSDANWQFIPGLNKQDLGISKADADNSTVYEAEFYSRPGSTQEFYWGFRKLGDPLSEIGGTVDFGFGGPGNEDTLLCPHIWTSVGGTSSVIGVSIMSMYFERYYLLP